MGIKVTCPNCGGEFVVPPSRIKKSRLNFCSKSCRTSYYNKINNPARRKDISRVKPITVKCAYCHRELVKKPYRIKGKQVFCSRSCVTRYYKPRTKWSRLNFSEVKRLFDIYKQSKNTKDFGKAIGSQSWGIIRRLFLKYFPDEFEKVIEERKIKTNMIYAIGRRFERKVRLFYEGLGYYVFQSPLSKSPADMIAIRNGEILAIQAKFNSDYIKREHVSKLIELAKSIGARAILVTRNTENSLHIKELSY